MGKERRDADRRSRQCARFARLIRIARLVTGNGRWGPDDLAREIDCSTRTVYRDVEILSAAGIPITFDKGTQAYRVPTGFRLGSLAPATVGVGDAASPAVHDLLVQARRVLREAEGLIASLRVLCDQLEAAKPTRP
ncbi:MAG: HTH domain-containing protein [Gemmataceae bacterium]|nr:HTH domain-containing protein [Gemmataceae bacterium]